MAKAERKRTTNRAKVHAFDIPVAVVFARVDLRRTFLIYAVNNVVARVYDGRRIHRAVRFYVFCVVRNAGRKKAKRNFLFIIRRFFGTDIDEPS